MASSPFSNSSLLVVHEETLTTDSSGYLFLSRDISELADAKVILMNAESNSSTINVYCLVPWKQKNNGQWITQCFEGNNHNVYVSGSVKLKYSYLK